MKINKSVIQANDTPLYGKGLYVKMRVCTIGLTRPPIGLHSAMILSTADLITDGNIRSVHGLRLTFSLFFFVFSGAHINPVVTLAAVMTTDAKHWCLSIVCVIMQIIGAIAGASLTRVGMHTLH